MVGAAANQANALADVPVVGQFITTLTENMTGLDPTELSEIRTQSESMVARLVPVVTGDDSGRYTDNEQARARDIQAQSKFWKWSDQVIGGLSELQSIQIRGEIRKSGGAALQMFSGSPISLVGPEGINDDGVNAWYETLINRYGIPPEKAEDEIIKHIDLLRGN